LFLALETFCVDRQRLQASGKIHNRMTPVFRRLTSALLFLASAAIAAIVFAGCGEEQKPKEIRTFADYFPMSIGGKPVRLQLAVQEHEQQRGLMERQSLGADDGMIFLYTKPQQMSFWMRNTLIPLDVAFFDSKGVLREVRTMYPRDERTVSSAGHDLQFAVEMNQGWFRSHGVGVGAKLDLAGLKAAVQARDFAPQQFGLN
jgi:uncharacterized membrane protein (UPF0127 family)